MARSVPPDREEEPGEFRTPLAPTEGTRPVEETAGYLGPGYRQGDGRRYQRGRMGSATNLVRVLPPSATAGFDAEQLDPTLQNALDILKDGTGLIRAILPEARILWEQLHAAAVKARETETGEMTRGGRDRLRRDLGQLVKLVERLGKLLVHTGRSMDDLTRLRSFVAGGPDRRGEWKIDDCSEAEMEAAVLAAAERILARRRPVAALEG